MKRLSFLIISVMWAPLLKTDSLPKAISCYQTGANSKNINAYISCFAENTEILDVTRFNNSHIEVSFYTHFGVKPGMIWMHMLIILKSSSIKTVAPPYAAEYV